MQDRAAQDRAAQDRAAQDRAAQDRAAPTGTAAVVRSYLAAFATADPDAIAGHVTEDFVNEHTAKLGSGCVGRAAYRERLPAFLGDMTELRYEIEDLIVDGDRAAVFYRLSARWSGRVPVQIRGVQRLVVADGLIRHRTDYWDSAIFVDQISGDQCDDDLPTEPPHTSSSIIDRSTDRR